MTVSSGRSRLIAAAERLVAERGINGVPASDVVRAAGHRNNSAIGYHFGSWQGLLDEVWVHRSSAVNARRRILLETYGDDPSIGDLVRAYVLPLVEEIDAQRPSYWARFNEEWLTTRPLEFLQGREVAATHPATETVTAAAAPLLSLLDGMASRLTQLPAAARERRVALMSRFVIGSLAALERDAANDGAGSPVAQHADEVITLAVAMLQAPPA